MEPKQMTAGSGETGRWRASRQRAADVVILSARASADQTEPRKLSVSGICEIPGEVLAREILVRMFG